LLIEIFLRKRLAAVKGKIVEAAPSRQFPSDATRETTNLIFKGLEWIQHV